MRTLTLIVAQIEVALDESERFEFEGLLVDRVYADLRAHDGLRMVGSPYVILGGVDVRHNYSYPRGSRSAKIKDLAMPVQEVLAAAMADARRRVTE